MKRCPKCGAVIPAPKAKFCPKCGAPISETPPQATAGWPPASFARRRRNGTIFVAVVMLLALVAILWVVVFGRFGQEPAQPVDAVVTAENAASSFSVAEENRLYCENLSAVEGMRITLNGQEIPYGVAEDGRVYLDRGDLTATDSLLRAILPSGQGYQTSLALVSKPSNPTASFGTLTTCDAEGYNDPDESYLDAMLTVYYKSQLQAFNSRKVSDLRFSTDLNAQSWEGDITMGAYDAVEYNLDTSDMVHTPAGLAYGDHKVTVNAAGNWTGVNRTTGKTESGTDYMTIQAIWQDGLWQVDRCLPCSEEDYENGTLQISSH